MRRPIVDQRQDIVAADSARIEQLTERDITDEFEDDDISTINGNLNNTVFYLLDTFKKSGMDANAAAFAAKNFHPLEAIIFAHKLRELDIPYEQGFHAYRETVLPIQRLHQRLGVSPADARYLWERFGREAFAPGFAYEAALREKENADFLLADSERITPRLCSLPYGCAASIPLSQLAKRKAKRVAEGFGITSVSAIPFSQLAEAEGKILANHLGICTAQEPYMTFGNEPAEYVETAMDQHR
ncbi:MAG: hypothetical protein V1743_07675 [Nanoarchaeota archaeon]